jgi:DNA-binding response OmpR family regulator
MNLINDVSSDELVVPPVKGIWCVELDVYICGTPVRLSVGEMRVFSVLLSDPEHIFSRQMLVQSRKKDPYHYGRDRLRSIDAFISRTREKIRATTGYTNIIIAEYGMGYHLNRKWYIAELQKRKAGQ